MSVEREERGKGKKVFGRLWPTFARSRSRSRFRASKKRAPDRRLLISRTDSRKFQGWSHESSFKALRRVFRVSSRETNKLVA